MIEGAKGALEVRRAHRGEEDEAPDACPLGGAEQPDRCQAVELLDRPTGLIADSRREVDDGVHAAQRMSHREGIAQVPEGDLHVDSVLPELAGIAHQDPDLHSRVEQGRQQLSADHAGRSRQQ